jgi:hypothetical protein
MVPLYFLDEPKRKSPPLALMREGRIECLRERPHALVICRAIKVEIEKSAIYAGRPNHGGCPMPSHKFHVGEMVNFRPTSRNVPGGAYEVVKQLPHNGREFEYRIKSANEEHQRVAGESELRSL